MSEIIMGQVRFLLVMFCLGMVLMCGYDFLRFFRWVIPHHKIVVAVEDILYWSLMAVPAYAVFFLYNDGAIRWYGVLAVIIGGVLYEKGISELLRKIGNRYLEKPKRKIIGWISGIKKRFRIKKRLKSLKKLFRNNKKRLKNPDR